MTVTVGLLLAGAIVVIALCAGVVYRRDGGTHLPTADAEHGDSAAWVASTRASDRSGMGPLG